MLALSPSVHERLGHYVYAYIDPRRGEIFYVGKGHADRALAHLAETSETRKVQRINEIRANGLEPQIDILVHGLASEEAALRVEAAVIDALGLPNLTNAVRGWDTGRLGRMPLEELVAIYAAKSVRVVHPSLLVRINRLYRYGMSPQHLYEVTRGVWKLGSRRSMARYALAVFHGIVREVFIVEEWHPAGTTSYEFRDQEQLRQPNRWEFVGAVAPESVRSLYVGCSVQQHHFKQGLQSPVVYAACNSNAG